MTFTIKNLNPVSTLPVHGISVLPLTKVDLVAAGIPTATILQSLINGELYNYAQGKQIGIIDINNLFTLGASETQIASLAYIGYFQGKIGGEDYKYPLTFDTSDNLKVSVAGIVIPPLSVDIHGDSVVPADRDSILAMGTDDGTIAGTVHVLKIGADLKAQVIDTIADGYLNTIVTNTTTADGYLNTISSNIALGKVQGFTDDGYAVTEMPVYVGGKYLSDPTAAPLTANNKGHLLLDVLRNLSVTLGTKLAGEDLNLDVMNTLAGCTYVSITTNTTTVIKSGAGALLGILFTTPGSVDNTVIFYDNTAASGTILIPSIPTDVAFTPKLLPLGGIYFNTGLTAITATGTASTFVVFYR